MTNDSAVDWTDAGGQLTVFPNLSSCAINGSGISGSGYLCEILFETKGAGTSPLTLGNGSLYQSQSGNISAIAGTTWINSSVEITQQYNLIISSAAYGNVTAPGIGTFPYANNQSVTITATPTDACWQFYRWEGDTDTIANMTAASTTIRMNNSYTITANFSIKTFALSVTANNSGGSPYFDGLTPFTCNTSVPIHANTSACYTFAGWIPTTGVDVPSAENTNVLMNATRSLTARYSIKQYTLTINAGIGGGTSNPSAGDYTYNCSTVVSVLAMPNDCRILKYWTSSNLSINGSVDNPISITMDGNKDLTPVFESSATFTLSLDKSPSAGGNPTANGSSFACGTYASIQANTDPCYNFVNWTPANGVTSPTSANTIVLMNTSRTLTANYAIKRFTLSTNVSPTGTGTVTGAGTYNCSFAAPIQANAVIPYAFDHWSGALSGNTNPTSITMDDNKSVTANFVINPNTVYFQNISRQTVGSNFSIQVMIYNTSYLAYGTFDIRYNSSILLFQSLTNSSSAIGNGTGSASTLGEMESGLLRIDIDYSSYTGSHGGDGVIGSGYLCSLTFSPIASGTSPLYFVAGQGTPPGELDLKQWINYEESSITPVYWLNGSVTVQ
jgi:hypothetical protein